jgi:hypothetical protein
MSALNQWQPIETAPKDGEYLVYIPKGRSAIQVAKRMPDFCIIGNMFDFDLLIKPTHWMPLPEAPKSEGKA